MFASCGGADKNGWYSDFDAAKKAAKAKNKNVLLLVNSDYDVPMTEVGVKAITSDRKFTDALKDFYVCVHFSFVDLQSFNKIELGCIYKMQRYEKNIYLCTLI